MIELSVRGDALHLEILGWTKLWALRWSLDIPLPCIQTATSGPPGLPSFRSGDLRVGGTSIPRLFAAGSYLMGASRRRAFLDLRRSSREVVKLELENYPYALIMVEVADAAKALALIRAAKKAAAAKPPG